MTIEEVKKMLEALGIKTDELKGAALEKAQAWLDAQRHKWTQKRGANAVSFGVASPAS